MKNYRFLVPVLLAVMLLASIYSLVSGKVEAQQTYNQYLEAAREYREMDIYIDAQRQYILALEERPSLELNLELASLYEDYGMGQLQGKLVKYAAKRIAAALGFADTRFQCVNFALLPAAVRSANGPPQHSAFLRMACRQFHLGVPPWV